MQIALLGTICIVIALLSDGAWALASGTRAALARELAEAARADERRRWRDADRPRRRARGHRAQELSRYGAASKPSLSAACASSRHDAGRADPGDRPEQLGDAARGPQVLGRQRAGERQLDRRRRHAPSAVCAAAHRIDVERLTGPCSTSSPSAWRPSSSAVPACSAGSHPSASSAAPKRARVARDERLERAATSLHPVGIYLFGGRAEIEDREPPVGEHEHVVRVEVGVDDPGARRPEREHQQSSGRLVSVRCLHERHAVDPLADEHLLVREPRHRGGDGDERVSAKRSMKAALGLGLLLEIELVEHALADLFDQRRRLRPRGTPPRAARAGPRAASGPGGPMRRARAAAP